MSRIALRLFVWLVALTPALSMAADAARPEIAVVYWSSKDCRWCTYWESPMSGMQKNFMASPEYAKVRFLTVKNERLADPYLREHFPPEAAWLWELYERKEIRQTGRPGWQVFVDRRLVETFYGTKNWDAKALPRIREIVARHGT